MQFRHLYRPPVLVCLALSVTLTLTGVPASAQEAAGLDTEESKILYALGLAIAQNLGQFALTADELAIVQKGLADSVLRREPEVELTEYGPKIQGFGMERVKAAAAIERAAAAGFLAEKEAEEGAAKTASGLILTEMVAGDGSSPAATDRVNVHYHGTLRDGTVFDSSVDRGEPVTFALNQVIPCWTEGVQTMKVGGKSRLVCPSDIAYGDQGRPPTIPGGAALVFEVELLGIVESPEADG